MCLFLYFGEKSRCLYATNRLLFYHITYQDQIIAHYAFDDADNIGNDRSSNGNNVIAEGVNKPIIETVGGRHFEYKLSNISNCTWKGYNRTVDQTNEYRHFSVFIRFKNNDQPFRKGTKKYMPRIILTTESGADVPKELADKYNIQIVPMHVIMDGQDYLDGSLPVQEIYDYYDRTKKTPTTTSTNAHEYTTFFTEIRKENPDCTLIHIGYTSKASSSFQNAVIASEDFDDLFLIDALNVTGGLAAIVLYAAELLEKDPTIKPEVLIGEIEGIVPKSRLAFVPGKLDFLRAGGRVSNVAYLGGALLKIKPRIELVEGKLVSTKKYRGKINMVAEKLVRDFLDDYNIDRKQLYFQYSIGLDETIKQRMNEIAKEAGFEAIMWMQAGAMISTHAGPGGFGIAGLEVK